MVAPTLFADTRTLARAGRFEALHEFQPVLLRDGSASIGLHAVRENGIDRMYLRAVPHGDALLVVFDLRDVCADLDEIRSVHEHDVPGLVLYTLRKQFPTRAELLQAMLAHPLDVLPIDPVAAHAPEGIAA